MHHPWRPFLNVPTRLALLLTLTALQLPAQAIRPRHVEGRMRGFVTIRNPEGRQIGYGDMSQSVTADRITFRMTYRFRDGSLDDEISVFSARSKTFSLISDRHIQRGPFFPHPLDLTTNAAGDSTNRTLDSDGKPKLETSHKDLPPGTAVVGMMSTLMANLDPATQSLQLPTLSPTAKPRLFHFLITPEPRGTFSIAGSRQTAEVFRLKTDLGGIAGMVAPLLDKQPDDIIAWVLEGAAPVVVRAIAQLYEGGPLVDIQLAGATFAKPGEAALNAANVDSSGEIHPLRAPCRTGNVPPHL